MKKLIKIYVKSVNSYKEIEKDFTDGFNTRIDKGYGSIPDFINYITIGASDFGVILGIISIDKFSIFSPSSLSLFIINRLLSNSASCFTKRLLRIHKHIRSIMLVQEVTLVWMFFLFYMIYLEEINL